MHIPDGYLSVEVAAVTGALAAAGIGAAVRGVNRSGEGVVPLTGMTAAFIFVAQMLNFPVLPGVSGHVVGAGLAVALLGPAQAVLALSAVVLLQAFLFSDGGITALGANLVNMALLGPAAAWSVCRLCGRCGIRPPLAAGFGAWAAILAGAAACATQLVFSATAAPGILPLMTGVHALIGLVEGVVTALAVGAVIRLRGARPVQEGMPLPLAGVLAAIAALAVITPFACGWPDGLEFAAERHVRQAAATDWQTPFSDYTWLGRDGSWPTVLIAFLGAGITFAAAWFIGRSCRMALARRRCGNG